MNEIESVVDFGKNKLEGWLGEQTQSLDRNVEAAITRAADARVADLLTTINGELREKTSSIIWSELGPSLQRLRERSGAITTEAEGVLNGHFRSFEEQSRRHVAHTVTKFEHEVLRVVREQVALVGATIDARVARSIMTQAPGIVTRTVTSSTQVRQTLEKHLHDLRWHVRTEAQVIY